MTRLIGGLIALLFVVSPLRGVADQQAFTARTTAVRVDVSVTQRGLTVPGLRPSDFEVRDNGVLQDVDFVNVEKVPLALTLALDWSGSVAGTRLAHLRRAAQDSMAALRPGDRSGLITFSNRVTLRVRPTTELSRLQSELGGSAGAGGTALVDASYAGLFLNEDQDFRSVLIVFSDGLDTVSWLTPSAVLEAAGRSQVVVYTVSVGGAVRVPFLHDLAATTGGAHLQVESTANLGKTFVAILEEFRQRYVLSYRPRGVSDTGWHRLDVRVKRGGVDVRARRGYVAGN